MTAAPKKQNPTAVILVIDEDPLTRIAVQGAMHLTGYEVYGAADAEAALKAVRGLELDLIICDIDLGEDNGFELCRELKNEPHMGDTPVLYVSERDGPEIVDMVHAAGGAYFIRKPYDPEMLLAFVEKALWMPHLISSHLAQPAALADKTKPARPNSSNAGADGSSA